MDVAHQRIEAAAQGDAEAYRRVVLETQNLVCSIAFAIVRDLRSSEEIAQDVFVSAWTGLKSLRSPDSFLPWLRQLTRNRAQDHLRRRHRVRPAADAALDAAADLRPGPEEQLLQREREQRLAAAVEALPDDAREVVLLYYREGQSVAQVAALLDLSEVAVKKRLSRARERLREALDSEVANDAAATAPSEKLSSVVVAALALNGGKAAPASPPAAGGVLSWPALPWIAAVALVAAVVAGAGAGVLRRHDSAPISAAPIAPVPAATSAAPPLPALPAARPETAADVQVSGSVELPSGGPAAGALVRAICGERSSETVTDGDGGFQLSLPQPGPCELRAEHGELHSGGLDVSAIEGPVTLALCESATVTGWVMRDDGPAADALVSVYADCETVSTHTDSSGRFSVTGGLEGHIDVCAIDGDLVAVKGTSSTSAEVALMLSKGGSIEGTVTDLHDQPLAGARVWLREESERHGFRIASFDRNLRVRGSDGISDSTNVVFQTVTDAKGHYRLSPVKRARYSVVGEWEDDRQVLQCDLRATPQTLLNFQLGEQPPAELPVVVDSWGNRLANAQLELRRQTAGATRSSRVMTGEDGTFEPPEGFAGPRHELLGPAQLTVVTADGLISRRPVEVSGTTLHIVVELASGTITGVAVDDDGLPVAKALVTAAPVDPASANSPILGATDDDGGFTLHPPQDGRYRVFLRSHRANVWALMPSQLRRPEEEPAGVDVDVRDGRSDPVRLSVGKRATIQGTVVDTRGVPVAGIRVWPSKIQNAGPDTSDALMSAHVAATTDAHGAFRLGPCSAGTYWFGLQDAAGHSLEAPEHDGVAAGATDVKLVLRAQPRVAGRVVSHGHALAHFSVNGAEVDLRDGRFEVVVYPSRQEQNRRMTRLELTAPGFAPRTLDLEMPETVTRLSTDIELVQLSDQVRGIVLDEATLEPVEGATVRTGTLSTKTDADGAFAFDEPLPLPVTLDVTHSTRATAQVTVRETEKPVMVRLGKGASIRGHVIRLDRSLPAHTVIAVLESETHLAEVAPDGSFSVQGLHRGRWQLSGTPLPIWATSRKPYVCAGPVLIEVGGADVDGVELKPQ